MNVTKAVDSLVSVIAGQNQDTLVSNAAEVVALYHITTLGNEVGAPDIFEESTSKDIPEGFAEGLCEGFSAALSLLVGRPGPEVIDGMKYISADLWSWWCELDASSDESPLNLRRALEESLLYVGDEDESEDESEDEENESDVAAAVEWANDTLTFSPQDCNAAKAANIILALASGQ